MHLHNLCIYVHNLFVLLQLLNTNQEFSRETVTVSNFVPIHLFFPSPNTLERNIHTSISKYVDASLSFG